MDGKNDTKANRKNRSIVASLCDGTRPLNIAGEGCGDTQAQCWMNEVQGTYRKSKAASTLVTGFTNEAAS
jgi:hypothetical protein